MFPLPVSRGIRRSLPLLLGLALIGGESSAQVIGEEMLSDGFETDPSIALDRAELESAHAEALLDLFEGAAPELPLSITFIGKRRRTDGDQFEAPVETTASTPSPDFEGMAAFNPRTGNEFLIGIQRTDLATIEARTATRGRQEAAGPGGGPPPGDNPDVTPGAKAWSNNSDDRVMYSSTSTGTEVWPWRAIAEHSNRCTGTLIGPRLIVTAGHCLYSRTNNAWSGSFFVTPGRAANNWSYGRSQVAAAGFTWYFTPAQWRQANPAGGSGQYDFGLMILPDRLGDATGWMGYATLSDSSMQNASIYNRGYPWCNATDNNGVARTDDVGDDPTSGLICFDRHLWGDPNLCSAGNFHDLDGDNWSRRFDHSCDASAGHSGSAMYTYLNGVPAVVGIHTTSLCGKTAADTPCNSGSTRPLRATRITPEYREFISYFRNWKP